MLPIDIVEKYDSGKICEAYNEWPKIARTSYYNKLPKLDLEEIDNIVFAGMGGSGTVGDVISSILSQTNIHVSVTKGYVLPKTVDSKTLVVVTSVSGNTDESLTILKNSIKTNAKTITFSSGGNLEEFSNKNNISNFKIPQFHSPRASLTSFLYTILGVLEDYLPIDKKEVEESINILDETKLNISSNNLTSTNPSLALASWISNIPAIYYPWGLQSVAIRFKNSLQENSKTHVITEDVIEVCHNGIVSWEGKQNVQPILIQGKDDNIKTKERWRILEDYFNERDVSFYTISSVSGSIISKITNLIYLLDYASIYLALLRKIDPTPVQSIDYMKNRI